MTGRHRIFESRTKSWEDLCADATAFAASVSLTPSRRISGASSVGRGSSQRCCRRCPVGRDARSGSCPCTARRAGNRPPRSRSWPQRWADRNGAPDYMSRPLRARSGRSPRGDSASGGSSGACPPSTSVPALRPDAGLLAQSRAALGLAVERPKPAINRHLKTGHFLNAVDRDVDRLSRSLRSFLERTAGARWSKRLLMTSLRVKRRLPLGETACAKLLWRDDSVLVVLVPRTAPLPPLHTGVRGVPGCGFGCPATRPRPL